MAQTLHEESPPVAFTKADRDLICLIARCMAEQLFGIGLAEHATLLVSQCDKVEEL